VRNTGKDSEAIFEEHWQQQGKAVYLYRFPDAAEIYGRNKKLVNVRSVPSDYLVTTEHGTFYAEVKSTLDPLTFNFSLLKKGQNSAGASVTVAKGVYLVYIHSLAHDQWYCIPYGVIRHTVEVVKKKSLRWDELKEYKCTL